MTLVDTRLVELSRDRWARGEGDGKVVFFGTDGSESKIEIA